jgi:hypothetical protein
MKIRVIMQNVNNNINMKSLLAVALTLSTLAFAHQEEGAKPADTHGKTSERLLDLT